jgi:hypothetical protein
VSHKKITFRRAVATAALPLAGLGLVACGGAQEEATQENSAVPGNTQIIQNDAVRTNLERRFETCKTDHPVDAASTSIGAQALRMSQQRGRVSCYSDTISELMARGWATDGDWNAMSNATDRLNANESRIGFEITVMTDGAKSAGLGDDLSGALPAKDADALRALYEKCPAPGDTSNGPYVDGHAAAADQLWQQATQEECAADAANTVGSSAQTDEAKLVLAKTSNQLRDDAGMHTFTASHQSDLAADD